MERMKERERGGTFLDVPLVVVHHLSNIPTENVVVVVKQLSKSVLVSKHFSHLCLHQLFQFSGHFTQVSKSFRKGPKLVRLQPFCQNKKDDRKRRRRFQGSLVTKLKEKETLGQIGI